MSKRKTTAGTRNAPRDAAAGRPAEAARPAALPAARPPRRRTWFLLATSLALVVWLVFLLWMAVGS